MKLTPGVVCVLGSLSYWLWDFMFVNLIWKQYKYFENTDDISHEVSW